MIAYKQRSDNTLIEELGGVLGEGGGGVFRDSYVG